MPGFVHVLATAGLGAAVVLAGKAARHEPEEAPRVEAEARLKPPGLWTETTTLPPEADNLECLLDTDHGRMHVEFGYRGCFGGSDDVLDLEGAALTRAKGQGDLRQLIEALIEEDEANSVGSTTKTFVRISYQCGTRRWGPFTVETTSRDEEEQRDLARMLHVKSFDHLPYARVHGTIAAARKLLASRPAKNDVTSGTPTR